MRLRAVLLSNTFSGIRLTQAGIQGRRETLSGSILGSKQDWAGVVRRFGDCDLAGVISNARAILSQRVAQHDSDETFSCLL